MVYVHADEIFKIAGLYESVFFKEYKKAPQVKPRRA